MPGIFSASLIAVAFVLYPLVAGAQMPHGKARPLVESMCSSCHALQLIQNSSGYTREQWRELVGAMVDLSGNSRLQNEITGYLSAHFPPNNQRTPKLVAGEFEVTFREWVVSQLGQRTRDPMQAPDGSIWYAGQYGNLIGRLDRKTGQAKEYPLPPDAMPHTVQLDPKGRPWYSGNKNDTIGWIDPASGRATVYKMRKNRPSFCLCLLF